MGKSYNVDNALPEALARLRAVATGIRDEYASLNCLSESGGRCMNSGRACSGCSRIWHPETDDVEPGNIYERCRECNQRLAAQAKAECTVCTNTWIAEEALQWLDSLTGVDLANPEERRRSEPISAKQTPANLNPIIRVKSAPIRGHFPVRTPNLYAD